MHYWLCKDHGTVLDAYGNPLEPIQTECHNCTMKRISVEEAILTMQEKKGFVCERKKESSWLSQFMIG